MKTRLLTSFAVLALAATPALAHPDPGTHGSVLAGLSHPVSGPDHLLAMIAVGLWATLLGRRAMLVVPGAFVFAMLSGFAASLYGLWLPVVEPMVLASIVALGLLAAVSLQVPSTIAAGVVGLFAVFHGYAHGSELGGADAVDFALGFVLSTAGLHAAGVVLGVGATGFLGQGFGRIAARAAGIAAAAGGLWMALAS